jgi:hypothetical protein
MANSYQQYSVAIRNLTDEECEWINNLLNAMNDAPDLTLDATGESNKDLVTEWKHFTKQVGPEMAEIVKDLAYDTEYADSGDKSYWGQAVLRQNDDLAEPYLWLYEEEGCTLDKPIGIVQEFFKKFRPTATLIFSWAETCSKPRVDEFGGGACLITADWVYWPPLQLEAMAKLYTEAKLVDKTITPDELEEELLRKRKVAKYMPSATSDE